MEQVARTEFDRHVDANRDDFQRVYDKLDHLQNRLPTWATFTFSLLTFLLGIAVTVIALALRGG